MNETQAELVDKVILGWRGFTNGRRYLKTIEKNGAVYVINRKWQGVRINADGSMLPQGAISP